VWLFGLRMKVHSDLASVNPQDILSGNDTLLKAKETNAFRRSRKIESYIVLWVCIELFCTVYIFYSKNLYAEYFIAFPVLRIFEIVVVTFNSILFDHIRLGYTHQLTLHITRTIILMLYNFIELMICFGYIYSSNLLKLIGAEGISDAYYFSVVTQLTIGYGDITPSGYFRIIASLQGILGYCFTIFAISRSIAFLPIMKGVFGDK
jgi:hypothetical protein